MNEDILELRRIIELVETSGVIKKRSYSDDSNEYEYYYYELVDNVWFELYEKDDGWILEYNLGYKRWKHRVYVDKYIEECISSELLTEERYGTKEKEPLWVILRRINNGLMKYLNR